MELLQKYTKHPLKINQLQFNPINATMIDSGIHVNMNNAFSIDHDGSILEYARLQNITIQPWSIMQASWTEGTFLSLPKYKALNDTLTTLGKQYGVDQSAMNLAWILRHPANMQPIVGTTSSKHLRSLCKGADITITREEWYKIYCSAGKQLP